ncbi:hypothetical protein PR001_g27668 [Phytophthora rubi]|uniref:Uncharacterized protein n=1 Tax=Phytophthora rubi TaxID=129364 RepID=A0A6A3HI95_9STRA|nr:hypothetical protein PR002_g27734 [Phytophthora rubi]KAE8968853.1 hypothetical protein PR001_g27668 [Phytophthora rubi]
MSSVDKDVAPLEPLIVRSLDPELDIVQWVNDFPRDASDETFVRLLRSHQSKKLRTGCTRLGLHPQADPQTNHNDGCIKLLTQYRRARIRGEVFTGTTKQKTGTGNVGIEVEGRTKHCGFRLANVMFSPTFFLRMVESGVLPSTGLKVDPVGGRVKFWREVAAAYASENPQLNVVVGQSGRYDGIDPKLAPHHSAAKLCAIWKDMTTRYEESLARWKQLGTGRAGFTHFCGDFLDGLYLHDWLQIRPIQVDPEQLRTVKRPRTDDVQQSNENTSVGAGSPQEQTRVERHNFLTPHEVEAATQSTASSSDETRDSAVNPDAIPASGQRQLFSMRQRRILPRVDPSRVDVPRHIGQTGVEQVPAQRQSPRTLEERLLRVLDANAEQRHVNKYDGVIYSSQAVRDTMSAIEALKRGRFDRAVIAQAEESMDAIVKVWLGELDKAGHGRVDW